MTDDDDERERERLQREQRAAAAEARMKAKVPAADPMVIEEPKEVAAPQTACPSPAVQLLSLPKQKFGTTTLRGGRRLSPQGGASSCPPR